MSNNPIILEVGAGGTGLSTLTAHALQVGAGTSPLTQVLGTTGTVLTGVTGADPAYSATPTITSVTFGSGNALGTYATTTYTPVLSFGGGSTGIVYTIQNGEYTQIGNMVIFGFSITTSSKGSSTGVTAVSLPVASGGTQCVCVAGIWAGLLLDAGYTQVTGVISGSSVAIYENGSNKTPTQISDTYSSAVTKIWMSGFYFTS